MCGIVGFRSDRDFDMLRGNLARAASTLAPRGPDDSGLFFDEQYRIGLGHTRLAVIDPSHRAHQPMTSNNGRVWIIYNGEIYNFRDLRRQLEQKGYRFKSNSDTEVVLNSYLEWGLECFPRFFGMFALAIWDGQKKELILARDRVGIKPLYYYYKDGNLVFASELKALVTFRHFRRDIDHEAIPLFLHYQYIPGPRSIFGDTFKLSPGHYLVYNGEEITLNKFNNLMESKVNPELSIYGEEEKIRELDELLTGVISDYLVSDVPLGALLSGGIDSSIVVAFMQKVSTSPVRTFTMGFQEAEYNEAPWASKVATHLGTDHTELYVTAKDALDVIPCLPEIYDEPFGDSSAIPTYLVCKLARSGVTVAVSGDGGDEQFSGYVRYWITRAMARVFAHLPRSLRTSLAACLKAIPPRWIERCYLPAREFLPRPYRVANFPDKWQKVIALMGNATIQELYRMTICVWPKEDLLRLMGKTVPEGSYEEIFRETEGWPFLSRLMRVDQHTYLPDAMMTKADRASMAVSLEVRVPLLDNRILEFTSPLPEDLKYRNGTGKYLLKRLLARYVPADLFERPKMGFGLPIDRWFRGDLKPLLLDYLSHERLKREGIFDPAVVEKTIHEHLSGKLNHHHRLWPLLVWEMWRERWLT
jgi:asparagine synthase (glutamine-hydrolysing)